MPDTSSSSSSLLPSSPLSPSAPPLIDLTTHDDTSFLLLTDMFPTLPTEDILVIIDSAPPSATTQYLVERCLERQDQLLPPTASSSSSPSLSSSSSAAAPSSSPPLPYIAFEMTSLLPAHSDSSTPPFPVPSAPPIPPTHSPLLSAMSSLHSSLLSSPIPPPTLLSHLHSLSHVLTNPLHHPSVPKYRTLPLSNAKFHEKVLSLPAAKAVILACGWQEVEGGDMLLLTDDLYEPALLEEGRRLLEEEVAFVTAMLPPQQGSAIGGREGGGGGTDVMTVDTIVDHPLYQSKRTWREESKAGRTQRAPPLRTATPRLSRDQLAAIAEHRVHPKSTPPPSLPPGAASREVRRGRQMRLEDVRRRRAEVEAMRRDKKEEWMSTRQGRKRVITVDDLERMRLEELEQRARFGTGMSDELLVEIGKEAMRLTNEFRKEQGERSEVVWHAAMADIGWKHSKNMGEGEVPFGHDGFSERHSEMRMSAAGENVFMCQGVAAVHVAKMAVDGWINSPGHRANMLRGWHYCGIGVYRKGEGSWWLTQLFANP